MVIDRVTYLRPFCLDLDECREWLHIQNIQLYLEYDGETQKTFPWWEVLLWSIGGDVPGYWLFQIFIFPVQRYFRFSFEEIKLGKVLHRINPEKSSVGKWEEEAWYKLRPTMVLNPNPKPKKLISKEREKIFSPLRKCHFLHCILGDRLLLSHCWLTRHPTFQSPPWERNRTRSITSKFNKLRPEKSGSAAPPTSPWSGTSLRKLHVLPSLTQNSRIYIREMRPNLPQSQILALELKYLSFLFSIELLSRLARVKIVQVTQSRLWFCLGSGKRPASTADIRLIITKRGFDFECCLFMRMLLALILCRLVAGEDRTICSQSLACLLIRFVVSTICPN